MPSRSIIRTGVGPHREPGNPFPRMAAINLPPARAARVQSRRNLSRSLSPKLDHSHSITRFDRSRTGPKSTIFKACKDGLISFSRDGRGRFLIEPAELHRVFTPFGAERATERAPEQAQTTDRTDANTLR